MAPVRRAAKKGKANKSSSRRRRSRSSRSRGCDGDKCTLGRRNQKQRREKRQARVVYKVRRPKKAATGYILFVKQFSRDQKKNNEEMTGMEIIRGAAKAWKKLSGSKKDDWNKRAGKGRAKFREQFDQYKVERQLLKRAPNAYALFVHQYWHQTPRQELSFAEMSENCADKWKELTDAQKNFFEKQSTEMAETHAAMMKTLSNGGRIQDFLPSGAGGQAQ